MSDQNNSFITSADLQNILNSLGSMLTRTLQEGRRQDKEMLSEMRKQVREEDLNRGKSIPMLSGIKPYCGKKSENLVAWCFQVSDMFDARCLDLQDRLRWVTPMLSDAALQWYLNVRQSIGKGTATNFTSWENFLQRLRDNFEPPNSDLHLRRQLRHLKQSGDIQEYVFLFRNIVGQIVDMSELDLVVNFIEGLRESTKTELVYRSPKTLEDAVRLAIAFDEAKLVGKNSPMRSPALERSEQSASNVPVPMEIGNLEKNRRRNRKGKCYVCGAPDHMSPACPKRKDDRKGERSKTNYKKEFKTQQIGHIAEEEEQETWDVECLQLGGSKLTVLNFKVDGVNGRALVDSGAAGNFIAKDFVARNEEVLGRRLTKGGGTIEVVDGSVKNVECMVSNVLLRNGPFKDKLSAKVIEIKNYDLILGKPWLRKHNPAVDWREDKLEIQKGENYYVLRGEKHFQPVRNQLAAIACEDDLKESEALVVLKEDHSSENSCKSSDALLKLKKLYPKVFQEVQGLPPARSAEHEITTVEGSKPVAIPPYRLSPLEGEALKKELKNLLHKGLIRPSNSPWSAPTLFVKKKDGSLRLCVDYRKLNQITVKNSYPIPRIDDLLDRLSKATVFSKLDLASGYHQIRVKENDIEKTAFGSRFGLFEFLVLPFGLMNAPGTFMKAMHDTFMEYLDDFLIVYLDDILIYSESMEQHWKHLILVFEKLNSQHFIVKESKCELCRDKIAFLGYVVSKDGVNTDPSKVATIQRLAAPSNVKEVRSFLGVVGFYRRFIPGFAAVAQPLSDLLRAEKAWTWGYKEETSFQKLKLLVTRAPCLKLPDYSKEFIVTCDASGFAIAGVLSQMFDDQEHPIAFESRKLNSHEMNYPVHELELLAIVYCLKKWKIYVEGREITVKTDHASLKHLRTQKNLSRRMARWMEFLDPLNLKITYIKGGNNIVADGLSRLAVNAIEYSDWPSLLPLYEEGKLPTDELDKEKLLQEERKNFDLSNGEIARVQKDGARIPFVPFASRVDLVDKIHHNCGHLGSEATFNLLKDRAWWPGQRKDVDTWVKNCVVCQRGDNRVAAVAQSHLRPMPVVQPFQRWGMDFIGKLPESPRGNQYIITAKDYGTRWPLAKAVPNSNAKTVARFLYEEIVIQFGCPSEIVSDQGKAFADQVLHEYLDTQGIKHLRTTAYHPRTNGLVERFNGLLGGMIKKFLDGRNPKDWDLFLPEALFACRIQISRITGASPFYLLYGIKPKIPGDLGQPKICHERASDKELVEWREATLARMKEDRLAASERLRRNQEESKRQFDKLVKPLELSIGDLVLLRNEAKKKFELDWKGPFRVRQVHRDNSALVKLNDLSENPLPDWINVDRLRKLNRGAAVGSDGYLLPSNVEETTRHSS